MDFQKEKKEIEHCKNKYHGKEDTDSATLKLRGEISQPSIEHRAENKTMKYLRYFFIRTTTLICLKTMTYITGMQKCNSLNFPTGVANTSS